MENLLLGIEPDAQTETPGEFQARMEKRAQRIMRKIESWDRDELAERYAWMLLLALEQRKATRELGQDLNLRDNTARRFQQLFRRVAPHAEEAIKARDDHKRGAAEKLKRDPKQAAKEKAFKMWQDWQAGRDRDKYKSGAAFASHIVDVLPLESTKNVEAWFTKWRREAKAKNTH